MLALCMIISVVVGFLLGFYTCTLMVMKDRKELKRIMETALEKERKTGKWINDEHDIPHCSCCQYIPAYDTALDDIFYSKYCPECGAKMEVDE